MVNAFWQAEIQATSSGKVGRVLQPGLYDSFDHRTGKKQEVSLTYENGAARALCRSRLFHHRL